MQTCDTVGHFAELVSAARDKRHPADQASLAAQQRLESPDVLPRDVANEITRQVYGTPNLTPVEEAASLRDKCLTPTRDEVSTNPAQAISNVLTPIQLTMGVNHIATSEGNLDVTLVWKDDDTRHGHDVFTATVPGTGQVAMPEGYAVTDDPADDQDMRRSIRFAHGRIGDEDMVVLLIAQRDPGHGATRTTYQVYRLKRDAVEGRFVLLTQTELPRRYCNADAALTAASGLMLRESYRGPRTTDGCPAN
jgi:hypothetical protein